MMRLIQSMYDRDRRVNADEGTDHGYADGAQIHGQLERDKFPDAFEDGASVQDGTGDGGQIVIQNDDVPGVLGDLRPGAHGKADVCPFECRRVIDAVPDHTDHFTLSNAVH